MNPNINNISSFLTSIAEGHLYQSFYHQRMGLLRLGLVSECRVTKNTTNDTNFSHIFFNIFNVIVDYFKTTLTSADTKQKKWLLIPKVASILDLFERTFSTNEFLSISGHIFSKKIYFLCCSHHSPIMGVHCHDRTGRFYPCALTVLIWLMDNMRTPTKI